ncbi:MAG: zinc-binding dehydrogenase [Chloroflexi bacterium]|nr:zinc-binding dehydrogenase [Chloroflexota bacterium]
MKFIRLHEIEDLQVHEEPVAVEGGKLIRIKSVGGIGNANLGQPIARDDLPHRAEAAKTCRADHAFVTAANSRSGEMRAATQGRGVDIAFESDGVQETVDESTAAVVSCGKNNYGGIPDDKTSLSASTVRREGLIIIIEV